MKTLLTISLAITLAALAIAANTAKAQAVVSWQGGTGLFGAPNWNVDGAANQNHPGVGGNTTTISAGTITDFTNANVGNIGGGTSLVIDGGAVSGDYLVADSDHTNDITLSSGSMTMSSSNSFRSNNVPFTGLINFTGAAGSASVAQTDLTGTAGQRMASKIGTSSGASFFAIDGTMVASGVEYDGTNLGAVNTGLASQVVNGRYFQISESGGTQTLELMAEVVTLTAVDDSANTLVDQSVLIDVLANDLDDGLPAALSIQSVGAPDFGGAVIESGQIRYTPPAGFEGIATFSYTITDGDGTDSANVTVLVSPSFAIEKIAALPAVQLIQNTRDDAYVTNPPLSNGNSLGQKFSLARAASLTGLVIPVASITSGGNLTLEIYNLANEVGDPVASPSYSYTGSIPVGVVAGDLLQLTLPTTLNFGKGSYMFALSTSDAEFTLKTNEAYLGGHLLEKNAGTGNQWANTGNGTLDLSFSILGAFDSDPSRVSPAPGPNIIHILVDDFGMTEHSVLTLLQGIAETDGYTRENYLSDFYETPTIETLATEGLNFTWSFTQPNCAPARAALLSGQYSPRSGNGVYNVGSLKRAGGQTTYLNAPNQGGNDENTVGEPDDDYINGLPESVPLAQALFDAGYVTCHIGKYHVGSGDPASPSHVTNQGIEFNYGGNNNGNPAGFFASGTPRKWPSNVGPELNPFARNYSQAYIDQHLQPVKSTGHDPNTLVGTAKHLTDGTGDAFIDFMNNHRVGENADHPVYVQLHFYATHTPINPRPDLLAKYQNKAAPPHPQTDGKREGFAALTESMDQAVARVLRYLDDPNGDGDPSDSIAGETLIVWTTDNGGEEPTTENFPLRGAKGQHLEGGIRVPLILRMPGTIPQGAVTDTLVHAVDFYPTFLDFAAGVANSPNPASATHKLDGESFYAHALDPQNVTRDRGPIFYHFPGYMDRRAYPLSMAIKDIGGQRFKYIYNYDPYYGPIDDYGGQRPDQHQLYNLSTDPRETLNLLDYIDVENGSDPSDADASRAYWDYLLHKDKADDMAAGLHAWLTQPGDDWNPIYATYKSNFPNGPTRDGKADGASTGPAPAQTPGEDLVSAPAGFNFSVAAPVSLGGNDLQFTYDSHEGFTYRIEASNTLLENSWMDVSGPLTASGETTVVTINDPSYATEERRFYRIALIE